METTVPVIKYDRVSNVPFVSVPAPVLYVDEMDPFEYVALKVSNRIVAVVPEKTCWLVAKEYDAVGRVFPK